MHANPMGRTYRLDTLRGTRGRSASNYRGQIAAHRAEVRDGARRARWAARPDGWGAIGEAADVEPFGPMFGPREALSQPWTIAHDRYRRARIRRSVRVAALTIRLAS